MDIANQILFGLAATSLVVMTGLNLTIWLGHRSVARLDDVAVADDFAFPSVTIVVTALNEAAVIEAALQSWLQLDYPDYRLIAVNDRSTDETGDILDAMAAQHSDRMQVRHIRELPDGWLGKNHALHSAAQNVDSDWILFTDADILMRPDALNKAIYYAENHNVDHLPLMFHCMMPTKFLQSFVVMFFIYFWAYFRPWAAKNPKSKAFIGIGGFNLIRNSAFKQINGFAPIRLRPDDDVMLGKLVKQHGFRQELVMGMNHVSVQWYSSLGQLIRGLEKNAFAGVDYRIWLVVGSSLVALLINVLPFFAVFLTAGMTQIMFAAAIGLMSLAVAYCASQLSLSYTVVLLYPAAVLMLIFIQWRTMILNLWEGGLNWRGTFYSLEELKRNRI